MREAGFDGREGIRAAEALRGGEPGRVQQILRGQHRVRERPGSDPTYPPQAIP